MRASILDIQPPIFLPDVVAVAEECGYHRYWVTEHHSPLQSASPTLATGLAAGISERLRVGMGGVLLRAQSPYRVAADMALLQTFYGGRLDLGIAGASPGDELARAITGAPPADDATYRSRIEELVRLVSSDASVPCSALVEGERPELWLCGTSPGSAHLAGAFGLRYAFHHQLAGARLDAASIGAIYRDAFRPRSPGDTPYFAIAAYGVIADAMSKPWTGRGAQGGAPSFTGSPAACAEQIEDLVARYGADEIFVDCFADELAARLDGLRALALALGLAS